MSDYTPGWPGVIERYESFMLRFQPNGEKTAGPTYEPADLTVWRSKSYHVAWVRHDDLAIEALRRMGMEAEMPQGRWFLLSLKGDTELVDTLPWQWKRKHRPFKGDIHEFWGPLAPDTDPQLLRFVEAEIRSQLQRF